MEIVKRVRFSALYNRHRFNDKGLSTMNILFNFDELGGKGDKAIAKIKREFKKHKVLIELVDVSKMKRSAGINYKELLLTSSDSQQVQFSVKATGDIFKVKLGAIIGGRTSLREMPIKHQDDQLKAIGEIAARLHKDMPSFQKKLAKAQKNELDQEVKDKIKKTVRNQLAELQALNAELDKQLEEAEQEINRLQGEQP